MRNSIETIIEPTTIAGRPCWQAVTRMSGREVDRSLPYSRGYARIKAREQHQKWDAREDRRMEVEYAVRHAGLIAA